MHPKKKNPRPSQEEIIQLGQAFLDAKKAAVGAVLAIDPSLASSKDPLADFAKAHPRLAPKLFESPTSDLSLVAKAATAAVEKNPESKPLTNFVKAYQQFSKLAERIDSQYFQMGL
jgi:hypothetical protein